MLSVCCCLLPLPSGESLLAQFGLVDLQSMKGLASQANIVFCSTICLVQTSHETSSQVVPQTVVA